MACFIVPAAEAVVTTVVAKALRSKENAAASSSDPAQGKLETPEKIRFSTKLGWLNKLLWGGAVLLAFEHLWHGEIVPWFPFLTAMSNPGETAEMLREMATVGVSMAALVTLIWVGMLVAAAIIEKRAPQQDAHQKEEADA